MHHLPLRAWVETAARLDEGGAADGPYRKSPLAYTQGRPAFRARRLDDLRAGNQAITPNEFAGQPAAGLRLRPWADLVPATEATLPDIWA